MLRAAKHAIIRLLWPPELMLTAGDVQEAREAEQRALYARNRYTKREPELVVVDRERAHRIIRDCTLHTQGGGFLASLFLTLVLFWIWLTVPASVSLWWVLLAGVFCAWKWYEVRLMYLVLDAAENAFDAASEPVDQAPGAKGRSQPNAPGAGRP
jgi:hypothetical protein